MSPNCSLKVLRDLKLFHQLKTCSQCLYMIRFMPRPNGKVRGKLCVSIAAGKRVRNLINWTNFSRLQIPSFPTHWINR